MSGFSVPVRGRLGGLLRLRIGGELPNRFPHHGAISEAVLNSDHLRDLAGLSDPPHHRAVWKLNADGFEVVHRCNSRSMFLTEPAVASATYARTEGGLPDSKERRCPASVAAADLLGAIVGVRPRPSLTAR